MVYGKRIVVVKVGQTGSLRRGAGKRVGICGAVWRFLGRLFGRSIDKNVKIIRQLRK